MASLRRRFSAPCRSSCAAGFFLAAVLSYCNVHAGGPGTGAAGFLQIPVGARASALGGALTAGTDNADAVYYNPAGLGLVRGPELSFSHNKFIEGISQQWFAAAYPCRAGTLGLGINYLSVPAFDAYDAADTRAGSVSAYDMAVHLAWGAVWPLDFAVLRSVAWGAGFKYISEKLDTETGTGYALDAGLLAETTFKGLKFGVNAENVFSTEIKFIQAGARPPLRVKTGMLYERPFPAARMTARLTLDQVFWKDRSGYTSAGLETIFYNALSVRLGYNGFGSIASGLALGFGFDLSAYTGRNIGVDYSYGATADFGAIHKLGISYKFGPRRPAAGKQAGLSRPERTAAPAGKIGAVAREAAAAGEPAESREDASFRLLLARLRDNDPVVVLETVSELSDLNDRRALEPLAALLTVRNVNVRLASLSGLGGLLYAKPPKTAAIPRSAAAYAAALRFISGALSDRAPAVRSRAAALLGYFGGAGAAGELRAALEREGTGAVRRAITKALKKLHSRFPEDKK
ncbi:MAG: hypothetical protein A2285_03685 [Elusimicrobia bacterium RIFOXYA12_FULL_57_11]|nr:MAG: hypothetical protein A2285_03685 [Elusimicrobia bacterium RIFOXYA12_FULL_57_11]